MSVTVAPAADTDIGLVAALEAQAVDCPWGERQLREALTDARYQMLTAAFCGVFAGYILTERILDEAHICSIAVCVPMRRRGVAQKLIAAALDGLKRDGVVRVFLEVRADNAAASGLYEKSGFKQLGVRDGYYGEGKAAATYMLEL